MVQLDRANALPLEVNIKKVENGFIVKIGCKTFVSTSWNEICVEVGAYFANPYKAQEEWNKKTKRFN